MNQTPPELEMYSNMVDFLDGQIETISYPPSDKHKKKTWEVIYATLTYYLPHFHTSTKVVLTLLLISIEIYIISGSTPIAQWIDGAVEDIYGFVVHTIDWIVTLLEIIYYWIEDAIETVLEGMKTTVNQVKEFSETTK
jgi:hypothetical protein